MGRGLSSKYNSPEAVEETGTRNADDNEEGADNKEGAVEEEDANNEDRVDKKESNNIGSARDGEKKKGEGVKTKKGGKSVYELTRESNIARNKELLRQIMKDSQIESTKKGDDESGMTKKKESSREEQRRGSTPLQRLR